MSGEKSLRKRFPHFCQDSDLRIETPFQFLRERLKIRAVCKSKKVPIQFPYQQFYLRQFGNTFVWWREGGSAFAGGDVSISA